MLENHDFKEFGKTEKYGKTRNLKVIILLIAELREWFILIKRSLLVILHRVSSWIVWLEVEFVLPSVQPLLIFQDFLQIF